MKILGIVALLFSLQALANERFITRIHSITYGATAEEAHLVKFQNARIGFFHHTNKIFPGELVEVEITEDHQLVSVQRLIEEDQISINTPFITEIDYVPTEIAGYSQAFEIMSRFRQGFLPGSESYDRAHVWAFEEYKRSNLHSMKAFIFFTDRYIRTFKHKWWFHVAPLVSYKNGHKKVEKVLDLSLAKRPLSLKKWSHRFMENDAHCQTIEKYSVYITNALKKDCYIIKSNMYYWQPNELEILEQEGIQKVNFFEWEITHSLKQAFGIVGTH